MQEIQKLLALFVRLREYNYSLPQRKGEGEVRRNLYSLILYSRKAPQFYVF